IHSISVEFAGDQLLEQGTKIHALAVVIAKTALLEKIIFNRGRRINQGRDMRRREPVFCSRPLQERGEARVENDLEGVILVSSLAGFSFRRNSRNAEGFEIR